MSVVWRPRDTTPQEDAGAVAIAMAAGALAGAASFWLARTLMGRERVELEPPAIEPTAIEPGPPRRRDLAPAAAGNGERGS